MTGSEFLEYMNYDSLENILYIKGFWFFKSDIYNNYVFPFLKDLQNIVMEKKLKNVFVDVKKMSAVDSTGIKNFVSYLVNDFNRQYNLLFRVDKSADHIFKTLEVITHINPERFIILDD